MFYKYSFLYNVNELKTSSSINSLGDCIKINRLRIGITQHELGKLVGLHPDTIHLLEKNKTYVHVKHILSIEIALNCILIGYDSYYDFARDTSTNIYNIRTKLCMTSLDFSSLLNIHKSTLYKWETNRSYIPRKYYKYLNDFNFI